MIANNSLNKSLCSAPSSPLSPMPCGVIRLGSSGIPALTKITVFLCSGSVDRVLVIPLSVDRVIRQRTGSTPPGSCAGPGLQPARSWASRQFAKAHATRWPPLKRFTEARNSSRSCVKSCPAGLSIVWTTAAKSPGSSCSMTFAPTSFACRMSSAAIGVEPSSTITTTEWSRNSSLRRTSGG